MLDLAERLGATRLLTGHYARIVEDAEGPLLAAGADAAKDQSYMLAALPPDLLGRLGFPLTEMTKDEVRAVAARHGLAVAKKPESQDLCFLAGQGKRGFLRRHGNLVDREGAVVDRTGRSARPPPRPPQLHGRAAPRDRRLAERAGLRPRHRRRRQHGHGRHPRGPRDAPHPRPRRGPPPRRRPRRQRPPPLPLGHPARHRRRRRAGPPRGPRAAARRAVRCRRAGPDRGADGRRDDRRPRHDRRCGLSRRRHPVRPARDIVYTNCQQTVGSPS